MLHEESVDLKNNASMDWNRLTVAVSRTELPLRHGLNGVVIQTHPYRAYDRTILGLTVFCDGESHD